MNSQPLQKLLRKRTLELKLLRLFSDQVRTIQREANQKGVKFNDAVRQLLDHAIGKDNAKTRNR